MFGTVLIANRGEIAVRVARTCRELGIRVVAVCSTADRDSAVTRLADATIQIGPPPARRSYLDAAALIEAALRSGADAIHPGYGFLSEDPDFADACGHAGVAFIGPSPETLERIGDKAAARALMARAGVPPLPGSPGAVENAADAKAIADEIGYPVMLKAVVGGGGRGMTAVRDPRSLFHAFAQTRARAQTVFGDGRVYLERLVEGVRHVEVQVVSDRYGNVVQLGERDCSVQRRHQKLLEEAPAPGLPGDLVACIRAAAVRGARAAGLVGVATFEFLVDRDGAFWFIEINGRIQVEHPVTEMVSGIDLVAEQLRVAAGMPLGLRQADMELRGVAVECRVNAEDPARGFAPTPGTLEEFVVPGGPFTRVDTHGFPGWRVTPHYDSLLAKVIVWAPERDLALARMDRALGEFRVRGPGVRTTIGFLRSTLAHPLFRRVRHTTALVEEVSAAGWGAAREPGASQAPAIGRAPAVGDVPAAGGRGRFEGR